jgi:hypothetical protein
MARIGQYNWSPRQMERINARRAERGRESLVNLKNIKTEEDLQKAQNLVASSKDTRKPVTMQAKAGATDMGKEAEERTRKFREKFKPKGSMAAEYGVKSRFPSAMKNGVKGGVGVMQNSLDRLSGAA